MADRLPMGFDLDVLRMQAQRAAGVLPQDRPESQADGGGYYRQDSPYLGASQDALTFANRGNFGGGLVSWPFELARGEGRDGSFMDRLMNTADAFSPVQAVIGAGQSFDRQARHLVGDTQYDMTTPEGRQESFMDVFGLAGMLPAAGVAAGRTIPEGAAGIFGGRLAKTADQAALKRAEDMAAKGVLREQIWQDTGWFKGVDGKWRFEIDDSQAEYLGGVKTARRFDKAIDHPDLAAAYPGLGAAPVRGVKPSEEMMGMVAAYNPITKEFALRNAPEFDTKTKSSGLHEAQHYIQGEEGFAQGSSEALARGDLNDRAAAAQISAHEAAIADKPTGLRYFSPKAWEDYYARLAETMTDRLRSRREAAETPRSRREILDAYKQSAGEVESRTVQKRMNLTPDQRRARPPWLDYDVPESQQIVRLASNPDDLTTSAILAAMQAQDKPKGITAYHGTTHQIEGPMRPHPGARGDAVYFNTNPQAASSYAGAGGDPGNYVRFAPEGDHPSVLPANITGRVFDEVAMVSPDERYAIAKAHNERVMARAAKKGRQVYPDELMDPGEFASKYFDRGYPPKGENVLQSLSYEGNEQNALLSTLGYHGRMGPAAGRTGGSDVAMFMPNSVKSATTGETLFSNRDPTTAAILALLTAQQGGQPQQ